VTVAGSSNTDVRGARGVSSPDAPLSRAIREDIARTILRWALPTMAVLLAVLLAIFSAYEVIPLTRLVVMTIWTVALGLSAWWMRRGQPLRAAAALLVGLVAVTTVGTLLHGVNAPAFIGIMPVMALLVPLFGVRWGLVGLAWHALVGLAALWLGAHGFLPTALPMRLEVRFAAVLVLTGATLAFLFVPTRLLLLSLRVSETRLREAELSREQERKSALALREASEQLAGARRLESLGKLSGGVAHDFNNMLGAIMAATDLISLDRNGREHPGLEGNLELIRTATDRAADLTRKLLAFGRQDNFGAQRIDINVLARDTAALARATLGGRVSLELDCSPEPLWVRGDRSALDHALLNLLLNARDALPGEGTIRIRTCEVTLEPAWCAASGFPVEPGQAVKLSVEDTGSGMPPEVRERLFERFSRPNQSGAAPAWAFPPFTAPYPAKKARCRSRASSAGAPFFTFICRWTARIPTPRAGHRRRLGYRLRWR